MGIFYETGSMEGVIFPLSIGVQKIVKEVNVERVGVKVLTYIPLISVVFIIITSCGIRYEKEQEENGSFFTAQPVYSRKPVRGSIAHDNDTDFYRISLKQDISKDILAHISVTENEDLDITIKIYRGKKVVKIINDSNSKTNTADRGEQIINALFPFEDVMEGNALFSIEGTFTNPDSSREFKKNYNLHVEIREKEDNEEGEPNDKAVTATDFGNHSILRGFFNPSANLLQDELLEEDWYSFTVSGKESQIVHISHTGVPGVDSVLSLYDDLGYLIRASDSSGKGEPEKLRNLGLEKGSYFIKIQPSTAYQQNYKVNYLLKLEREPKKNSECETNDRYPYANLLQYSKDIRGCFNPKGDIDWYRFNVYSPGRQVITVRVGPTADIDPVIELYSYSLDKIISVNDRGYDEGEIIKNIGVEEGVYYVKLYNKDEWVDNPDDEYSIFIEKIPWEEDREFELNNSTQMADEFLTGSLKKGFISPRGDKDFYVLRVDEPSDYKLELTPCVLLDLVLKIYDSNGDLVAHFDENPIEEGEKGSMFFLPGLYYIEVFSNNLNENSRDTYFLRMYKNL